MIRAAFLDRDGVINADHGYVHRIDDFHFLPGVVAALRRLAGAGFLPVIVTNQSGIARGLFDEADYRALTAHLLAELAGAGVAVGGVYHCPHHPEGSVAAYRRACDCRKPAPGLLHRAIAELGIDPAASILVGDKASDIAAGRAAGVGRCYLVGAGQGEDCDADGRFADLAACVAALPGIVSAAPAA